MVGKVEGLEELQKQNQPHWRLSKGDGQGTAPKQQEDWAACVAQNQAANSAQRRATLKFTKVQVAKAARARVEAWPSRRYHARNVASGRLV